jgi:hypothetical protein
MLATILIVVLVMALLGVLPRWRHSREWCYVPTGGVGLTLVVAFPPQAYRNEGVR